MIRKAGQLVLLLLDNAVCHSPDMHFSNIKIVFLPANTTSVLQPLDLGIIKVFKVYCRSSASKVVKSVIILHAVRFVGEAPDNVSELTLKIAL